MSLGDKVKKEAIIEAAEQVLRTAEKTAHISFHITGPGVDKIDFYEDMENMAEEFDFKITSGNVNIYYTEKKKKE